jgi:hypothetical protein
MSTPDAILLSQLPLIVMALFYLREFRRIRKALEEMSNKIENKSSRL